MRSCVALLRASPVWVALSLVACKGRPLDEPWCTADTAAPPVTGSSPTWTEIGPIFAQKCGACHVEGGHAPFAVDTYAEVAPWLTSIRTAVADRTMPPWLAAECCQPWYADYSLTEEERADVLAWVDAGGPEGTGDGAARDPIGGLSRTDLTLSMPAPYTPGPGDELRCFVLDWPETERRYVTGLLPSPGARSIVHHLIVATVGPDDADELAAADDADPEPGFDCTGGLGDLPSPSPIGGSLLGGDYPRGLGTPVEPGSKIVLQVHYSVNDPTEIPSDLTSIAFRLDDTAVEQSGILLVNPAWMVGESMLIPAGDADAAFYYRFRPTLYTGGQPMDLQGVTPHMHRYASRMRVMVIHDDGTVDCLLEIPRWEFGWEQGYWFAEPVPLDPKDELYLECHFDNSAANQPEGGEPRDIAWGESDQDMCVAFLSATVSASAVASSGSGS